MWFEFWDNGERVKSKIVKWGEELIFLIYIE